jgi:hypothetical protein
MTSAVGAPSGPSVPPEAYGARHRRPDQRRRNLEKFFAALALFAAFAATVVLLGLQWLGSQSSASSAPVFAPANASHPFTSEVQAS